MNPRSPKPLLTELSLMITMIFTIIATATVAFVGSLIAGRSQNCSFSLANHYSFRQHSRAEIFSKGFRTILSWYSPSKRISVGGWRKRVRRILRQMRTTQNTRALRIWGKRKWVHLGTYSACFSGLLTASTFPCALEQEPKVLKSVSLPLRNMECQKWGISGEKWPRHRKNFPKVDIEHIMFLRPRPRPSPDHDRQSRIYHYEGGELA